MLRDYRATVEQHGRRIQGRKDLAREFGNFIAGLAEWSWFINPITYRDRGHEPITPRVGSSGGLCTPDPRLSSWRPSSRDWRMPGPPAPDWALSKTMKFLLDLESQAREPVGFVIGEEFGRVGGRYHCHVLVSGVSTVRRDLAWRKAFELFGRTRIEPFDPQRAAAFYTAKYAAKQLGGLHFGGTLAGVNLGQIENRTPASGGRNVIVHSAELPRDMFRMTFPRRHK